MIISYIFSKMRHERLVCGFNFSTMQPDNMALPFLIIMNDCLSQPTQPTGLMITIFSYFIAFMIQLDSHEYEYFLLWLFLIHVEMRCSLRRTIYCTENHLTSSLSLSLPSIFLYIFILSASLNSLHCWRKQNLFFVSETMPNRMHKSFLVIFHRHIFSTARISLSLAAFSQTSTDSFQNLQQKGMSQKSSHVDDIMLIFSCFSSHL